MKWLRGLSIYTIFILLLVSATIKEIVWAGNIVIFISWFAFILSIFLCVALGDEKIRKEILEIAETKILPVHISIPINICIVLYMIRCGWIYTGIIYCMSNVITYSIIKDVREEKTNANT